MKISQIFNLNKTQAELDFVDIDPSKDLPVFLNPFFLSLRQDRLSIEASRSVRSFFRKVISQIRSGNLEEARKLFSYLQEPNSTCLGLSRGNPNGRGVGKTNADSIFNNILESKAIESGLIKDLEDNVLFVENFDKDRLSDMTTNIILKHLIKYTQDQCKLHGVPLNKDVPSGHYWNRQTDRWEQELTEMLVIDVRVIILVPKGIASYSKDYTSDKYYNHFILNFMQSEHLSMNSVLVQERKSGVRYVTKKSLKEQNPLSKEFLANFTRKHPELLTDFKSNTSSESLTNLELPSSNNLDVKQLINHLIDSLSQVTAGSIDATKYHRLITGILELLFYPKLVYPTLENEIHDGRKRIDLTFDNAAADGLFYRLSNNMNLPCPYIMIECKNYSSDPANPELDQLAGRFSPNRGKVGFLLCRTIDNMDRFIARCQDTYADARGLIIPLVDDDLVLMLNNYDNWDHKFIDTYLSDRIRRIAIN